MITVGSVSAGSYDRYRYIYLRTLVHENETRSFVTYARKTSAAARPRKVATPDTRTWLAPLVSVCWEPAAEPEPDAPEPDARALPVVVAWWPDAELEPDADDVATALSVYSSDEANVRQLLTAGAVGV